MKLIKGGESEDGILRDNTANLLEKLNDIPTLPVIALQVNALLNDPKSSASDVAHVMKRDQALTAKVLKLVNSSYYGIPGGVTDVQRALAYLGFNTMGQIILSLSVFSTLDVKGTQEFSIHEFWKHALGVAIASELLSKDTGYGKPEEAFTCGLLHDLGKIVLYMIHKPTLLEIVKTAKENDVSFVEAEKLLDVRSHTYFGEVIASKWGLPMIIQNTIHYHHSDVTDLKSVVPSHKPIIQIVSIADALVKQLGIGDSGDGKSEPVPETLLLKSGISEEVIHQVKGRLFREMEKAEGYLRYAA